MSSPLHWTVATMNAVTLALGHDAVILVECPPLAHVHIHVPTVRMSITLHSLPTSHHSLPWNPSAARIHDSYWDLLRGED